MYKIVLGLMRRAHNETHPKTFAKSILHLVVVCGVATVIAVAWLLDDGYGS